MTKISRDDLLKLAQISYIKIEEQHIDRLAQEIGDVLSYASILQKVAKDKHPEQLPQNCNIMREDFVQKTNSEEILALAPERQENYFVVPVILKQ